MQDIRRLLAEIREARRPDEALAQRAYYGFTQAQEERLQKQGLSLYRGKVRELVKKDGYVYMVHTDRLSAFDCYIGMVPYKGLILSAISAFWCEAIRGEIPNHLIHQEDERTLKVEDLTPFKIEVVVRSYMAGSMMRAYQNGERIFCGVELGNSLRPYAKLPQPLITPTTKAAVYQHDEDVSPKQLIERGVCTSDEWEQICQLALRLFAIGERIYAEKGWILVDTKYEFGKTADGRIKLIDEAHTPDSSRLWVTATYEERLAHALAPEMLDKENVRRWLMDKGFSGKGRVPEVPANIMVDLAEVYLQVAESLLRRPIKAEPMYQTPMHLFGL